MNRKILLFGFCLATILLTISMVSAADTDFHEDVGLNYTAPDGYEYDGCYSVIGVMDIQAKDEGAIFKYSNGDDNVSVTAFAAKSSSNDDLKKSLNPGVKEKTIGDKKGFIDSLGGSVTFYYLDDGKFIYINAPDESTVEKMLK